MESWKPASKSEVETLVKKQLKDCSEKQQVYFETIRVNLYPAKIFRFELLEDVYVVAQKDSEVIYFEDVEEGFNISPTNNKGGLLKNYCDQLDLKHVLYRWMNNLDPPGSLKEASR